MLIENKGDKSIWILKGKVYWDKGKCWSKG